MVLITVIHLTLFIYIHTCLFRIADRLLGDALEGVASEVEQLCDHYVEGMYTNEFIGPP